MATPPANCNLSAVSPGTLQRKVPAPESFTSGRIWPTVVGIALTLILWEVPLRLLPGLPRPVQEDSVNGSVLTTFYYSEGLAISHFTPSRARLTGNRVLPGAPYVVIVGDSYVEALQVSDQQTMGSVLERKARRSGQAVNVRQYGWSGDSPAHYALIARELQQLWQPTLVCVILNADDFTPEALKNHWAEMKLRANAPPTITPVEQGGDGQLRAMASWLMLHSGLMKAVLQRGILDILPTLWRMETPETSAEGIDDSTIVDASVEVLNRAYGDALLIVLIQNPDITGGYSPTTLENHFRQSCAAHKVDCITTRQAFVDLRDTRRRFGFGFSNSLPQAGHINADGHRLVAELIWADYRHRMYEGK